MALRYLTEQVVGTSFSFYSDDELRRLSVRRVTSAVTFDAFNRPLPGGLYDRALGPTEHGVACTTCGLNDFECPGHLGHIELAVALYNPTLFPLLFRLLRLKCFACHRFRVLALHAEALKVKLMLLDCGLLAKALDLDAQIASLGSTSVSKAKAAPKAPRRARAATAPGGSGAAQAKKRQKKRRAGDDDDDDDDSGGGDEDFNDDTGGQAAEGAPEAEAVADGGATALDAAEAAASSLSLQLKLLADKALDCVAQCGPDVGCGLRSSRDSQYSQHVREERARAISAFMLSFPAKKCANCGALALGIKKDGYSKIFQQGLERKAAQTMASKGHRYYSALGLLRVREMRRQSKAAAAARRLKGNAGGGRGEGGGDGSQGGEGDGGEEDGEEGDAAEAAAFAAAEELLAPEDEDEGHADRLLDDDEGAVGGVAPPRGTAPKAKGDLRYMLQTEAAAQMQLLWEHEGELVRRLFLPVSAAPGTDAEGSLLRFRSFAPSGSPPDAGATPSAGSGARGGDASAGWRHLFLSVLPVTAPRFRPPTRMGENTFEHPQNVYLSKIITLNDELIELGLGGTAAAAAGPQQDAAAQLRALAAVKAGHIRGGVDLKRALGVWTDLQNCVNGLMDSSRTKTGTGSLPPPGIRQLLEKKEGMFRKFMMGKRVNYAARTVISPDPFLRVDQVGVPLRFAMRLSYKQPVTAWNVAQMRELVLNGPDQWPGATHVEDSNGTLVDLSTRTRPQREALAKKLMLAPHSLENPSELGAVGAPQSLLHKVDVDAGAGAAAAAAGGLPGVGVSRVWRHLLDDDLVLMNRQPTLHKPSLMAHRARVMKSWSQQQIFRFHYANCKSYNADFDGDEMNMHLPQDELGRAEAACLVATDFQYLSGTGGAPLRGLIQDHVGIASVLTMRDQLLTRDAYCQLVFAGLQSLPRFGLGGSTRVAGAAGVEPGGADAAAALPPVLDVPLQGPAVLKPRSLWTGKQVISTILAALTLHLPETARALHVDGKSKIGDGMWGAGGGRKDSLPVGESAIVIRNNELLCGVLDKNALGNSSYGLIHCVFELHGAEMAGALLSCLGRLLTVFLQHSGITCGVGDLCLTPAADAKREALVLKGTETGALAAAAFAGVAPPPAAKLGVGAGAGAGAAGVPAPSALDSPTWVRSVRRGTRDRLRGGAAGADVTGQAAFTAAVLLDNAVKSSMASTHGALIDACLPFGLARTFPSNQFSLMVQSGAKGSLVNHAMIAVGLGQQELEGRRVPPMASGKTLPCFLARDPAPRSGGYISDRFLTGLRPQDYFFHCMSGREGLIDTAVKTSRSGYLQRCLVKHLEALRVHYDHSVRDADGGLVSFRYGEDGLEVAATPYMQARDDQLGFLAHNRGALTHAFGMANSNFRLAASLLNAEAAPLHYEHITAARQVRAEGHHAVAQASAAASSAASTGGAALARALQALEPRMANGCVVELRLPLDSGAEGAAAGGGAEGVEGGDEAPPHRSHLAREVAAVAAAAAAAGDLGQPRDEGDDEGRRRRDSVCSVGSSGVLTVDGRRAFRHADYFASSASSSSSYFVEATVLRVRPVPGAGSSYDLRFVLPPSGGGGAAAVVRARRVPAVLAGVADAAGAAGAALVIVRPLLPDPVDSLLEPGCHLGALPELLLDRLADYARRNPQGLLRQALPPAHAAVKLQPGTTARPPAAATAPSGPGGIISEAAFLTLLRVKAARSLVQPGEPVGVVAAQSLGAEATQMTLNTFHLAGGGGVNVTLGIPRLREILMTASASPRTPQMTLPLHAALDLHAAQHAARARAVAGGISRRLSPLPLCDLLAVGRPADGGIAVSESLRPPSTDPDVLSAGAGVAAIAGAWSRAYSVRLYVADPAAVAACFGLSFADVAAKVASEFVPRLLKIISDDARRTARAAAAHGGVGSKVQGGARKGKTDADADGGGGNAEGEGEGEGDNGEAADVGKAQQRRAATAELALEQDDGEEADEDEAAAARLSRGGKGKGRGWAATEAGEADEEVDGTTAAREQGKREVGGYDDVDEGVDEYDDIKGADADRDGAASALSSSSSDDSASTDSTSSSDVSSSSSVATVAPRSARPDSKAAAKAKTAKAKAATAKALGKKGKAGTQENDATAGKTKGARAKAKSALLAVPAASVALVKPVADDDAEERAFGVRKGGVHTVEVPDALRRHANFGGVTAFERSVEGGGDGKDEEVSEPWIEVTLLFPASARKVLMLFAAERAARTANVRHVKGVTRSIVAKARLGQQREERTCVMTEGVNLHEMWRLAADLGAASAQVQAFAASAGTAAAAAATAAAVPAFLSQLRASQPVVDVNRLQTNDIHAMLRHYGVEAARACIVREMRGVFDAYGIGVDVRHLYLIADYMTQGGGFRPMNRRGIEAHGSPYLKMSFETCAGFLVDALLSNEHERMVSPSARLVMGRIVDSGTGAFDMLAPL